LGKIIFASNTCTMRFLLLSIAALLMVSCSAGLEERQLGSSSYFLKIPSDYQLINNGGEDFLLYYFAPADTSDHTKVNGGIMVGTFPAPFGPDSPDCKTAKKKGIVDGLDVEWSIYNCNGVYFMEGLTGNYGEVQIHAFGNYYKAEDEALLTEILQSLRKN
jgi:hypothetical protein